MEKETSMKAVRYHSYGDSGVLVHEEADRPEAAAGQVVLKVAGAGFNLLDTAIRLGILQEMAPIALPHSPGIELSGTVSEIGEGVSGWNLGDAVVAILPMAAQGAAAEYAAVPAEALVAAPTTVPLADAAALPVAGLTAWQALFEHAKPEAEQRILINGAGGGIGGHAIRLAKQAGLHVTATASPRSRDRVREAGADEIVDYTATPVAEALAGRQFELVLHLVRGSDEEAEQAAGLVASGGVFVSTATPGPDDIGRGVRVEKVFMRGDAAQLADLVARVDAGELKIEVAERIPLADTASVHDRGAAGKLAGKTILIP